MTDKNFYISTDYGSKKEFITYCSEGFIITEADLLIILKILIAERRNMKIGKKLLTIYKDATTDRISITEERLKKYCIKDDRPKQTKQENHRK